MRLLSDEEKFKIVIEKNTFFFRAEDFEEKWESHISSLANSLHILKQKLEECAGYTQKKELLVDFITERREGLTALLALFGISEEFFTRLITYVRLSRYTDKELDKLVNGFPREEEEEIKGIKEWNKDFIYRKIQQDKNFAQAVINLLLEGSTTPSFQNLPLFQFKKFDPKKLDFSTDTLIDTIIRLARAGSYAAKPETNPVGLIRGVLEANKIQYEEGKKLDKLPKDIRRNIDFVIPNHINPKIIVQCSYEVTTSSGMGDKAKTEINMSKIIKEKYPNSVFVGFVDGIGWYVRKGDLKRMIKAFENVFTFKKSEIKRFLEFVRSILGSKQNHY